MPPCLSTVASRIAFCHQPSSFVATATRCRLMSPTVVSCRRPRTSFVFSNRCCHMHTPHMMNVTLKIVAAQLWRNPEHFAQPEEATGNKRLPESIRPWCQDGHGNRSFMTASTSTRRRDLLLPFILCCQKWPRTSAPHSGKSADEAPIDKKRFSLFSRARFPSK